MTIEKILVEKKYDITKKVFVDKSQMEQIFLNLIINARDAIKPEGKGVIRITINEDNKFIRIRIKDTGIGMDKNTQKRIFEPFFTTKGDSGKGSGLGLAIVLRIIENHNGQIYVNSYLGKGTEFIIMLPVV